MSEAKISKGWNFDNTYTRLNDKFFSRVQPTPVHEPGLPVFNEPLARELGLNGAGLNSSEGAAIFAGNVIPEGAEPVAQAYAGHQFGGFNMLGDGRAVLLGEHVTPQGQRFDVQLKGSGPTVYSRRGDGRAALGPMLREYIISEAMYALGIPTTRSLAVATTGQPVFRETPLPGAVLTRIASSHIRVGTFEYAAFIAGPEYLKTLADYTLKRHYLELVSETEPYLALLNAVIDKQAAIIAKWMHVGFIHGVMNTDNMTISGETIDYGPCAFMDQYSHSTVFSSIDQNGRYAYGNQPQMAQWNLTRFAETLLPLISSNEEEAAEKATHAIESFGEIFKRYWLTGMRAKVGLVGEDPDDLPLIGNLFGWMEQTKADFTKTFRDLSMDAPLDSKLKNDPQFNEWYQRWEARKPLKTLMRSHNPASIPRNYRVEEALGAATEKEDYSVMQRLLTALRSPYEDPSQDPAYLAPPASCDGYKTFCGT